MADKDSTIQQIRSWVLDGDPLDASTKVSLDWRKLSIGIIGSATTAVVVGWIQILQGFRNWIASTTAGLRSWIFGFVDRIDHILDLAYGLAVESFETSTTILGPFTFVAGLVSAATMMLVIGWVIDYVG